MARFVATSILVLTFFAIPAKSTELPSRSPGLWEITTSFPFLKVPGQVSWECVDAATDQMMQSISGPNSQRECSKRDVQKSTGLVTIVSICTGSSGRVRTSHITITGSFDSAYTMTVATQDAATPAVNMGMTMEAKWISSCTADQKPGDVIMPNGVKINVRDLEKRETSGVPKQPQ